MYRVARFFFVQYTKTGKIYQIKQKNTTLSENNPNVYKIYQMVVK
jgi:hypothetical protein